MSSALTAPTYTTMKGGDAASYKTINTKFSDLVSFVNKIYTNSIYVSGDTVSLGTLHTAGYTATSKTEVSFMIPIAHTMEATKCTLTATCKVRQNGKYHYPGGSTTSSTTGEFSLTSSNATCRVQPSGIAVQASFSKAMSDIENNTGVGVQLSSAKLTFS